MIEENAKNNVSNEQGADQPEQLTAEEILAQRERDIEAREKAIEAKERAEKAKKMLAERDLPSDLSEFISADSEQQLEEKINRLAEIMNDHRKKSLKNLPDISTGAEMSRPARDHTDNFINGFRG